MFHFVHVITTSTFYRVLLKKKMSILSSLLHLYLNCITTKSNTFKRHREIEFQNIHIAHTFYYLLIRHYNESFQLSFSFIFLSLVAKEFTDALTTYQYDMCIFDIYLLMPDFSGTMLS